MGQQQVAGRQRFGDYLRRIREERRLSLDSVEEMSLGFRERITKSHLSRIETGKALPTFPRMFTLSQIYGVPVTSLAERFEIELWRQSAGSDPVASSGDLLVEIDRLKLAGRYLEMLSAATVALETRGPELGEEVRRKLWLHQIGSLIHLERYETAKNECERLLAERSLPEELRLRATVAFVICCYRLERYTIAQMAVEDAERRLAALPGDHPQIRALLAVNRAEILVALDRHDEAIQHYEIAASEWERIPDSHEASRARINRASALIRVGRGTEARIELQKLLQTAERSGFHRLAAFAQGQLGIVAFERGELDAAEGYLLRSNQIARPMDWVSLLFSNCLVLWKIARQRGDEAAMKLNERTLRSYSGRVPASLPEVVEFRRELAGGVE